MSLRKDEEHKTFDFLKPCQTNRYELPEQHEPLIVLIPEDGAPDRGMTSDSLAKEIKSRRAEGATATLVFDEALRDAARESGLLLEEEGEGDEAEQPPLSPSKGRERSKQHQSTPGCYAARPV